MNIRDLEALLRDIKKQFDAWPPSLQQSPYGFAPVVQARLKDAIDYCQQQRAKRAAKLRTKRAKQ